jgi:hypothetical protein
MKTPDSYRGHATSTTLVEIGLAAATIAFIASPGARRLARGRQQK